MDRFPIGRHVIDAIPIFTPPRSPPSLHTPPPLLLLSFFMTRYYVLAYTTPGFVIVHDRFLSLFRRYLQSHFVPAFEILLLLIVSSSFPLHIFVKLVFAVVAFAVACRVYSPPLFATWTYRFIYRGGRCLLSHICLTDITTPSRAA